MSYLSVQLSSCQLWILESGAKERVQIGNKDLRNIRIVIEAWRMKGIMQEEFIV